MNVAIDTCRERMAAIHPPLAELNPALDAALVWWNARDDMGGFRTAARELFPRWNCRSGAGLPPHREDRLPSFSMRSNAPGAWFFKDHAANEIGGLVKFVMLAGMSQAQAAQWLVERAPQSAGKTQNHQPEEKTTTMNTNVSNQSTSHINGNTAPASGPAITVLPAPARAGDAATGDDYPAPLAEAAYHGIAGEIVRLIEPHTEADPAALLFQLLAAFGNLIGRDAHTVADGARHGLNLFGALVGQSSKGRKGTSWNQIAALLERLDPDWKNTRVTSGLSSGEGLIWHVRDSATAPRPDDDKPGEYRETVVDSGVADKRLMVVEGEFAGTLKVMARETNTLSPVIRAAWDSGSMRTLTKNTPVKATGAHISIIGHITRDELRRLMGEIEFANGFANRFCWLAVRRSKCLPEGGRIDTVNFNDIILRMRAAIDFARHPGGTGELKRDEAARDLWRGIYPVLSEGRPGLLGAVTGRAEAQVMRLGALYALLDGSAVIRPAHHYAAMAVWSYSEQSARWIFGTATGDKNADKILAALKQAGREGMTRSEISEKVFQRNIIKAALSDALAILQQAGMAQLQREMHGNAACERWSPPNE